MIVLEFIRSDFEVISGIPATVEISVSDPAAIVYYTLDGSTPSPYSSIYTSGITMPTDLGKVTLSAVAYMFDGTEYVPNTVLAETYGVDSQALGPLYSIHGGVAYIYPGGMDIPFWYDFAGNPVTYLDIPFDPNDFLTSDRNADGTYRDDVWFKQMAGPSQTPQRDGPNLAYLSRLTNEDFNPDAPMIVIDTREGSTHQPDVPVFNGPHMTLRDPDKYYRGLDYRSVGGTNHISGHFVKWFLNADTGTYVAYYYDSIDSRWIKSVSTIEVTNSVRTEPTYRLPLVFQWNQWGRYSIY